MHNVVYKRIRFAFAFSSPSSIIVNEQAMEVQKPASSPENGDTTRRRELGGVKTMPFILGYEACDRFAGSGFHVNMITYLTTELNLPMVKASNILNNFGGTSNLAPVAGAVIADAFVGRFWTLLVSSLIYQLGMASLMISALLPQLRPPKCPEQHDCKEATGAQLLVLYACLLLTSVGIGGIRPCAMPFAADQIDMSNSNGEKRAWSFFNWYYFCMGFAALAAMTVLVYIQDNYGWGWGLGIPTVFMGIAIVLFVLGSPLYRKLRPGGSPFTRLVQVIVAAFKKRNVAVPADPGALYQNRELDAAISSGGRLMHTRQFSWFDRAAVVVSETDFDETNENPNLWRLATVHRVEEVKSIIRVLPIWGAGILVSAAFANLHNFTILQARTMNRHITHSFDFPPASLGVFSVITLLAGLVAYDRLFVPFASRFTGNPAGITCLQRMGIGFAISILVTVVQALVEIKRKAAAAEHGLLDKPAAVIPISVFWLLPQFVLHGIADVFNSVGHMEFLYDQSPESMRSTVIALASLTASLGNYIGTILTSTVHKYTGRDGNWLPDRNLNRGRLQNYYWLATGIQAVNLIYYLVCACNYTYKPLEQLTDQTSDIELTSTGELEK